MASSPLLEDPKHWFQRAEEARTLAGIITDPESKRMMLKIADDYDKLALRAAQRAAKPPQSK